MPFGTPRGRRAVPDARIDRVNQPALEVRWNGKAHAISFL